jgi:hypothetical protein
VVLAYQAIVALVAYLVTVAHQGLVVSLVIAEYLVIVDLAYQVIVAFLVSLAQLDLAVFLATVALVATAVK